MKAAGSGEPINESEGTGFPVFLGPSFIGFTILFEFFLYRVPFQSPVQFIGNVGMFRPGIFPVLVVIVAVVLKKPGQGTGF